MALDDPAGDGRAGKRGGERGAPEPARVLQLRQVGDQLPLFVVGAEAGHELARKGPALAPHIGEVPDAYPGFLQHLTLGALLQALAQIAEPGGEAEIAGGPFPLADEEHLVAAPHQHERTGIDGGEVFVPARGAELAPQAGNPGSLASAPGTEGALLLPEPQLLRHAGDGQAGVVQVSCE